jgi:hypothetical protein
MNYIIDSEKRIPVNGSYDLIVCGGGPAGVSAAISAGRMGLKTLLLESEGCLGGIWTTGLLSLMQDAGFKKGLMQEIKDKLISVSGYSLQPTGKSDAYDGSEDYTYDAECMKYILEQACLESGVQIRLYTRVVDAVVRQNQLTAIITEGHSGREAFCGQYFIDCTGNGDLAAFSGCSCQTGHPQTGKIQPATLLAFISGFPQWFATTGSNESKHVFKSLLSDAGFTPSYRKASLFRLPNPGICCIMINHEFDVPCDSSEKMTNATIHARKELHDAITALRGVKDWENIRLVATAAHIGLREGRRIEGLYQVTREDLMAGARFDDGICQVGYPVDIHQLDSTEDATHRGGIITKPYQIPFRSLVARAVTNLALAGRCISGDFYAHASYRVTGNAVPMGEAAGVATALAYRLKQSYHELDGRLVREAMIRQGHIL